MSHLNSCFSGMAPATKDLEIAQRIGKFGVCSDGQNVVAFQTTPFATLNALPAVTVQCLHPQSFPAGTACDLGRVPLVFAP